MGLEVPGGHCPQLCESLARFILAFHTRTLDPPALEHILRCVSPRGIHGYQHCRHHWSMEGDMGLEGEGCHPPQLGESLSIFILAPHTRPLDPPTHQHITRRVSKRGFWWYQLCSRHLSVEGDMGMESEGGHYPQLGGQGTRQVQTRPPYSPL